MNFRLFYKNPISGKLNFLYTHCVHCGKRVSLNRKNMGENRFGQKFYYCNDPSRHELKNAQDNKETIEKYSFLHLNIPRENLQDGYEAIFDAIEDTKEKFKCPDLDPLILQRDRKDGTIKEVIDINEWDMTLEDPPCLEVNLKTTFRVKILSTDDLICPFCNKEIPFEEEVYVTGIGFLVNQKKRRYLCVGEIMLAHLECATRELKEDEKVE